MPYHDDVTRSFYQTPFKAEQPSAPHDEPGSEEEGIDDFEHQSRTVHRNVLWKHVEEHWNDETLRYGEKVMKVSNRDGGSPAFIIRDKFERTSGRKSTTFELHSPHLRKVVSELFNPYETQMSVSAGSSVIPSASDLPGDGVSQIDFKHAYYSRAFFRFQLEAARTESQGSRWRNLHEFSQCLEMICSPLDNRLCALVSKGKITYELLWCIFSPGVDLFMTCQITGAPRCVRVNRSQESIDQFGMRLFRIEAWFFTMSGRCTYNIDIPFFKGASSIDSLPVYPLDNHPQCDVMTEKLKENGLRYLSWIKIHLLEHEGIAFCADGQGGTWTQQREGRIIVDRANASSECYKASSAQWKEKDRLLCSPTVSGFCLITNSNLQFAVDHISDVVWLPSAYDCISASNPDRGQLLMLAKQHYSRNDNPILKEMPVTCGRGTRLLLHGPVGVGKTTMASTIAECCKRPLLSISVGSIGVNPTRDEDELGTIFHLAERWEAVLIVEEADILLAQSCDGTQIGAVVSMAIRKLRSFTGLSFLITSRPPSIDEKIRNIIDCVVEFQPLNMEARKKLWQRCLGQVATLHGFPDCEALTEGIVSRELNGHEIQSTVHVAYSIAGGKGDNIRLRHLEAALEMRSGSWSDYGQFRRTGDSV
ncbi:hypothetical protein FSARC_1860 [Fusarium sarcochroum]|uniref:AAA+ ATPase domain-containing protein n=1 Tax=Fusarium sarcochroum TaxID=1208366 RepID=A0A8H4XDK9_9HYPO|nr:hypothetical protein FSARC_1860 [Fusarium sarcochroum]